MSLATRASEPSNNLVSTLDFHLELSGYARLGAAQCFDPYTRYYMQSSVPWSAKGALSEERGGVPMLLLRIKNVYIQR